MDDSNEIPLYQSHLGTLRISGSTAPRKAGMCAYHYLNEGVESVEFFCIGANANHNAMKSMGIFMLAVEAETNKQVTISFQPRRYRTVVVEEGQESFKDCVVWRTVIHAKADITNDEEKATRGIEKNTD